MIKAEHTNKGSVKTNFDGMTVDLLEEFAAIVNHFLDHLPAGLLIEIVAATDKAHKEG